MVGRRLPNNNNVDDFLYECASKFITCDDWHIKWVRINDKFEVYADKKVNLPAKNLDFLPTSAELLLEVNADDQIVKGVVPYAQMNYCEFKKSERQRYEATLARGQWDRAESQKFLFYPEHNFLAVNFNKKAMCFYVKEALVKPLTDVLNTQIVKELPPNVSYLRNTV